MRASQGLAWLLVAGLSIPAGAAGKTGNTPGKYVPWGDDEVDEIEVVKAFKFADYTGVSVAPLERARRLPAKARKPRTSRGRSPGWTSRSSRE